MSITRKLIFYFSAVIVSFALIIGLVFTLTFQNQTKEAVNQSLIDQSNQLVTLINPSDLSVDEKALNESINRLNLTDARAWVIDLKGSIYYLTTRTSMGMGMMRDTSHLSESTQDLLEEVFEGKQITTQAIKGFFNSDALTVGTPIVVDNKVVGALFISATIQSISEISQEGLSILFVSLGIGLVLAIVLGYLLSLRFVRPLKEATEGVDELMKGNYEVQFTHRSSDEIGVLSNNLQALSVELKSARDASANLEKMRQNFISDITHELRTPVTIIRGLTEGLKDEIYQASDALPQIIEQTQDMQRLINDLLELSKLEDPDFEIVKERFEWHDLIKDVARSAQALLDHKTQQLIITQDSDEVIEGFGDTQRLKQMFLAIIDNASKFSEAKKPITLSFGQKDGKVVVAIQDFGKGMREDQVKELFMRYKKDNQDNPNGNGLGLLIVSKIAQKHDIAIDVESKVNEGTLFRFKVNHV